MKKKKKRCEERIKKKKMLADNFQENDCSTAGDVTDDEGDVDVEQGAQDAGVDNPEQNISNNEMVAGIFVAIFWSLALLVVVSW